ncbi:uncharacterized protein [Typha latifolia]|uniref:uncharacterized protein n=1 Tax=Typha latifolia TaxID=4733 RepID=UPI003C2B4DC5
MATPSPDQAVGGKSQNGDTQATEGEQEGGPRRSWASVAAGGKPAKGTSGPAKGLNGRIPEEILAKLREQTEDCIIIDPEVLERCRSRRKLTLFGRFLGRSLPLELLKRNLSRLWNGIDRFAASDMSGGYYLFRFEKEEDMVHALTKGPWTIQGRVLHLIPWRNNFRPSAEAFTSAPVWIQLHNLPQEYWELEALVPVAGYFGKPLRVDETTMDHTRSRFARVCVEIELEKPLKKAVWLGPKEDKVDLRVVYENIPMFCYRCGGIGHRAGWLRTYE